MSAPDLGAQAATAYLPRCGECGAALCTHDRGVRHEPARSTCGTLERERALTVLAAHYLARHRPRATPESVLLEVTDALRRAAGEPGATPAVGEAIVWRGAKYRLRGVLSGCHELAPAGPNWRNARDADCLTLCYVVWTFDRTASVWRALGDRT